MATITTNTFKNLIAPQRRNDLPKDDFRILDSWVDYEDNPNSVCDRILKFMCYEIELKNPETGEKHHFYKAVKFARVIRLPKSAKQSTALMDMHEQVLTACYENEMNLITVIANVIKPKPLGLFYLYGVQGIAEDIDSAKEKCNQDYIGFTYALQGTYRVLEMRTINAQETEWLKDKLYNMDYMTVIRGIPKANKSAEDGGNKGMGGKNLNPDSQGTLEEVISGMADFEYVLQILTTPVKYNTLKGLSLRNERQMTDWYSQLQGQSSLSMNISMPMMYGASAGRSSGWSHNYTNSESVSYSTGESFNQSVGQSASESLSHSFNESYGESSSHSVGTSVGHSVNYGNSLSTSQSVNNSIGTSEGMSSNVSTGENIGSSYGHNISSGTSSGMNMSHGTNSSESIGDSTSLNYSKGTSDTSSYGTSENISHGTSNGYSESQSYSESQGMTHGQSSSESYSGSLSSSHSSSVSNGSNWGSGGSFSNGNNHSVSSGLSSSESSNAGMSLNVLGVGGNTGSGSSSGYNGGESYGTSDSSGESWNNGGSSSNSSSDSISESSGWGNSYSDSYSTSSSASVGQSQSTSISESNSISQGFNQSNSHGVTESVSMGQSTSHNVSTGSSDSIGYNVGQNNSMGENWGTSYGTSNSYSLGNNIGKSMSSGESAGLSQGQNYSTGSTTSSSETYGTGTSHSISNGTSVGTTTGTSNSTSQGSSYSVGNGTSASESLGSSGSVNTGVSSSMGLGPSIGYSKSHQWLDQQVKDIIELLEFNNNRYKRALRSNGAFYTYVHFACSSQECLAAAQSVSKAAWQNENAMTHPLQVLDLSEAEQQHLLYHFSAFSSDPMKEDVYGMKDYKYCTMLLPDELTAYTHLPRISEGGIFSEVNDIPHFACPSGLKGDIYLGKIINSERWTMENGYDTPYDYRIEEGALMHGIVTGASRSGKTVCAMRFVKELSRIKRKKTGKRLRIVALDPKRDWRGIAKFVEPERFRFYSLGNVNFHPIKLNPWKIPKGVWPQIWIDGIIDIYCRSYGLLERGKQMIADVVYELYAKAGVFEACDKEDWKAVVPELSKAVCFEAIYKGMEQKRDDLANSRKTGYDTMDAYSRLLDRLSTFSREYSIERRLFGTSEGLGIDELIGDDDVTVLESKGLENTFKNFIFGAITSGFYKYALAHDKGFLSEDQYETVLVIEEANEVLIGNDCAGSTGSNQSASISGESEFEQIVDQAAGYGLFIFAITQKISLMPKSLIANAGIKMIGRVGSQDDINVAAIAIGKEPRYEDRDVVKWFPRAPIGWFICQCSRGFDYKQAEPILVKVAKLDVPTPTNEDLEEILIMRDLARKSKGLLN